MQREGQRSETAKAEQGKQKFMGTAGLQEAGAEASTGYSSSRRGRDHGASVQSGGQRGCRVNRGNRSVLKSRVSGEHGENQGTGCSRNRALISTEGA